MNQKHLPLDQTWSHLQKEEIELASLTGLMALEIKENSLHRFRMLQPL
jgi:phosphotransferase system HPr-like phosphotransfer protein